MVVALRRTTLLLAQAVFNAGASWTGGIPRSLRIGAPYGLDLHDFPTSGERLHHVALHALQVVVRDSLAAWTLYFLAGFVAVGVSVPLLCLTVLSTLTGRVVPGRGPVRDEAVALLTTSDRPRSESVGSTAPRRWTTWCSGWSSPPDRVDPHPAIRRHGAAGGAGARGLSCRRPGPVARWHRRGRPAHRCTQLDGARAAEPDVRVTIFEADVRDATLVGAGTEHPLFER